MEENEFTPVVYDPNARISLWFFKIFGFGVYRVLELNSSCNLVVAIFAFCLNVLKNICFDRFVFSRDRLMLSELRYDTLSIYEELIVTNL